MAKVKKRDGRIEEFIEDKIIGGCKRAGASAKEAAQVAREVAAKIAKMTVVQAHELSKMVVDSLKKINKAAADAFVKFRDEKIRKKVKTER